jgi:hypothetical protein
MLHISTGAERKKTWLGIIPQLDLQNNQFFSGHACVVSNLGYFMLQQTRFSHLAFKKTKI